MKAIFGQLRSPAMLVACIGLIVALGGVSYAASVLPKNSVGATQLQKKAVTASKLRANSVSGAKVKDGTLMATDFKAGQLPAGAQGPKGDPGAQGPKGDAGAPGISAYEIVHVTSSPADPGAIAHAEVECPSGEKALGGGLASGQPVAVINSRPSEDGTVWYANGKNMGAVPSVIAAYAICAHVG